MGRMPAFPISIEWPVLAAPITSFSVTQATSTCHQRDKGERRSGHSWRWGPKHPQDMCKADSFTSELRSPVAMLPPVFGGHEVPFWRCLFPSGFIWKQPSLLRLRQLCDRNQGLKVLWHFKGTFLTHTKTGRGEDTSRALAASWLDSQEHSGNPRTKISTQGFCHWWQS